MLHEAGLIQTPSLENFSTEGISHRYPQLPSYTRANHTGLGKTPRGIVCLASYRGQRFSSLRQSHYHALQVPAIADPMAHNLAHRAAC